MPERSAWHDNVYNYPPVPLLLFTALRSLGIGLVGAKVVLTCIDGLTGLLIGIRSRSRVLGIAAAALPQAQRWVTGEGQYEPLQAAFTVGSLVALERFPFVAGVLLALAVQSKVTAVFVVPALLWQAHRIGRRHRRRTGLGLAAGLAPSLVFQLSYPLVQQVLGESSLVPDNAWRLRPFGGPLFSPLGGPLAPMLYGTMLAVVGAALWFALRRRAGIDHLATLAFAGFVFLHANVAPWYLLLLPSFAVVPREVTQRRVMLVIAAVAGLVTVRLASG
jgi:hypothetical protein